MVEDDAQDNRARQAVIATEGKRTREETSRTSWQEGWRLARWIHERRWAGPMMVVLGLGAALADTLSVGLAVMLLFALLGQTDKIAEGGGILARLNDVMQGLFGTDPVMIALVFFALILFNALLVYAYKVMTATMMNHVAQRMRDLVHRQYVTVGYSYLQNKEHGELIHILATETWTVSDAFFNFARIGVSICATLVFGLGLFALSWVVGLTALICALIVFALLRLLSRPVRRLGQETLAANQILAERMLVSLHGMRTLRVFAQEDNLLQVFATASARVRQLAVRTERIKALIGPLGEVGSLGTLIVIALVAKTVGVDIPTTIAAVLLLFRLQPHLREIESSRLALAGMNASLRSVREMLDEDKPMIVAGHTPFTGMRDVLRFEAVSFTHDPRRGRSLDRVSFTIRQGATTLLAGPSGSGKTTILNLILRLYDPEGGRITVDGVNLRDFARKDWLGRLAIAGQDVELIEGTVAQNIRFGTQDVSPGALREVCEMVEILNDIEALPDGFDTRIGSAGLNFSGGQRQRIGLARALLRNPDFLILDEAMSAIEPARENRIRDRLAKRLAGRTVLVVSHRSDSRDRVDAVIEIAQGHVMAQDGPAGV